MARPVAADAEATKRRILDCARTLFSSQGQGETSMRQIAKGAGVSLATVHHYYVNKAGLFQAAVDHMYAELAQLRDELMPVFAEADDLQATLRAAIHRSYRFVREHVDEVRLLMRTVIGSGQSPADRREDFLMPLLQLGSTMVAEATGTDVVRARMTLLTLNHLVIRYALTEAEELVEVTGVEGRGKLAGRLSKAEGRVEDHLVDIASAMLGLDLK